MIREFESGAKRDTDAGKLDYEGFLSPAVLERFAQYMHKNREMADGSLRDSDNWQKGIPREQYMKSLFRHFMSAWKAHRGVGGPMDRGALQEDLCGVLFNTMGYLLEELRPVSHAGSGSGPTTAPDLNTDFLDQLAQLQAANARVATPHPERGL